jgi:hypothetical protein
MLAVVQHDRICSAVRFPSLEHKSRAGHPIPGDRGMMSLRALGESSVLAVQGWVGEKSSQIDTTRSERK